jgi:hypothetical protein
MQTRILQRTLVQCPSAQADRRLTEFFAAHPAPDGRVARMSLWIDAKLPSLGPAARLERTVTVTVRRNHHAGDMTPRYAVTWAPAEPGPFPLFSGELRVDNDEDYDAFWLVLEGTYEPPLGILGAAFDRIAGSRIAAVCARNLLAEIADAVEAQTAEDEARKAGAMGSSA